MLAAAVFSENEKRVEIVRLIEQYLYENNFDDIARQLEQKSGILYESPNVTFLKNAIMNKNFEAIVGSLKSFHFAEHVLSQMLFAVSAFKYIETVRGRDQQATLLTLRNEVTIHPGSAAYIAQLTKLLIIDEDKALEEAINSLPAIFPKSSKNLLSVLMNLSPENFIIPDSRLDALLQQARAFQISQCAFHTHSNISHLSLFRDHKCIQDCLQLIQVSPTHSAHGDEIWHLSSSGTLLVSASKDKSGAIWTLSPTSNELQEIYRVGSFRKPVSYSAISPSSKWCFFSGQDGNSYLINSQNTREPALSLSYLHSLSIVSAVFVDDSSIITASDDQTIVWYDIVEKTPKFRWTEINCNHLCLLQENILVAACAPKLLIGIGLQDHQEVFRIQLEEEVTFISSDKVRYVLLSTLRNVILLFDLNSKKIVKRYQGHVNQRYHLQNCFVGQNMVASGSEDGSLVIWHRDSSNKVLQHVVQEGISINAVTYNAGVFYVGSDDGRIRAFKFI